MQITYPNFDKLAPDEEIDADILKALYQTIADHVIVPEDISPAGGFPGSMIQTNSLDGDRLIDTSVHAAKLAPDAVGTTSVADLSITKAKLTTTVGLKATYAQLEMTVHEVTIPADAITVAGSAWAVEVAHNPSSAFPVASNYLLGAFMREVGVSGAGNAVKSVLLKLSSAGANWACTVRADGGGIGNAGNFSGTLVYVFLAKS